MSRFAAVLMVVAAAHVNGVAVQPSVPRVPLPSGMIPADPNGNRQQRRAAAAEARRGA